MQQTGRHALHLAEVIQIAKEGQWTAPLMYPEARVAGVRTAARERARRRAASILAGIGVAGVIVAGFALTRKKNR